MKHAESAELLDVLHEPRVGDVFESVSSMTMRHFRIDSERGGYLYLYNFSGRVGEGRILKTYLVQLLRTGRVVLVVDPDRMRGPMLSKQWLDELDALFREP